MRLTYQVSPNHVSRIDTVERTFSELRRGDGPKVNRVRDGPAKAFEAGPQVIEVYLAASQQHAVGRCCSVSMIWIPPVDRCLTATCHVAPDARFVGLNLECSETMILEGLSYSGERNSCEHVTQFRSHCRRDW